MRTMEALVYEGPRELNVRSVPVPEPGADEVLIRVSRVGICGSELSGYLGHNSLRVPPLIMGHEFAGTVVQAGHAVGSLHAGDRVTVNPLMACGHCRWCKEAAPQLCADRRIIGAYRPGAFAEYVAVPAANVLVLPDSVTMESGAWTEPLACAVHIGRLAQWQPGDRLLVFGAGPIGVLAMLSAQIGGLTDIVVMDLDRSRLGAVQAFGGIGLASADELRSAAPADGFDVVVDAVGADATRRQAVEFARRGGRIVFSGLHEADSRLPINAAVRNEITMRGAFCYDSSDFRTALDWLSEGRVDLRDHTRLRPLSEGKACFEQLLTGPNHSTKIMLEIGESP